MAPPSLHDGKNGFQALRQFVRPKGTEARERCDLCAAPVPPAHQHLLEPASRALLCACQACAILFSAPDSKYRRVPRRIRLIRDINMSDQLWEDLAIPINMAYFYHDSAANRVKAAYPSPAGATESLLSLDAWKELVATYPVLGNIEHDVEALLANRLSSTNDAGAEYFLVPIDECYKLVGLIRTYWRGLSGGTEVWEHLAQYFTSLRHRALTVEATHA